MSRTSVLGRTIALMAVFAGCGAITAYVASSSVALMSVGGAALGGLVAGIMHLWLWNRSGSS